jgi:Holliday junction resolvase-like predicted endonuclease
MDLFEEIVMTYLTKLDDHVFVRHQFPVKEGSPSNWRWPDFVTLDFKNRIVSIVEVSTAYNIDRLAEKVNNRENQWIIRIRDQLMTQNVIDSSWNFMVKVFIREKRCDEFSNKIKDHNGVEIIKLEDISFPWEYNIIKHEEK